MSRCSSRRPEVEELVAAYRDDLRAAGIVSSERRDKWVYYHLAKQPNPDCARHLKTLVSTFNKKDVLRTDVERLLKSKGPGACKPPKPHAPTSGTA